MPRLIYTADNCICKNLNFPSVIYLEDSKTASISGYLWKMAFRAFEKNDFYIKNKDSKERQYVLCSYFDYVLHVLLFVYFGWLIATVDNKCLFLA